MQGHTQYTTEVQPDRLAVSLQCECGARVFAPILEMEDDTDRERRARLWMQSHIQEVADEADRVAGAALVERRGRRARERTYDPATSLLETVAAAQPDAPLPAVELPKADADEAPEDPRRMTEAWQLAVAGRPNLGTFTWTPVEGSSIREAVEAAAHSIICNPNQLDAVASGLTDYLEAK